MGVLAQVRIANPNSAPPNGSANRWHSVSTIGLINGGTAGVIWMYLVCWIGFMLVNVSMAEMASM